MPVRAFLALDISQGVRDALVAARRQLDGPDAKIKWVAAENLHVTLKFLGDVGDEQVAEVCAAAAEVAARVGATAYDVRGVRVVPPRGRPRMVWAGVDDTTGGVGEIFKRLEPALADLGFEPETRGFNPHVTLGRVKFIRDHQRLRRSAEAFAERHFGRVRADCLVVYSSKLSPRGPVYTPLARPRLGGG